jgi:hypothetical protein
MQDLLPKQQKELNTKFKNGLTIKEVESAKQILSDVNVSKICAKVGVKISTVYNVLRDESSRINEFGKVIRAAKREIAKRQSTIKELAL